MKRSLNLRYCLHGNLLLLLLLLLPFFLLRLHQLGVGCSCCSDSPHVAYLFTADGDASAEPWRRHGRQEDSVVRAE